MNRLIVPAAAIRANVPATRPRSTELSGRERQVLRLRAAGCTDREIGRRLGISIGTAAGYLKTARAKLGAYDSFQAVEYARERGLLEGGEHDGQAQAA